MTGVKALARSLGLAGIATLALLAVGVAVAAPASGHATVVSSSPADGSRLQQAPREVVITFDEPVGIGGIGYLHVTNGSGIAVDSGEAFHPAGAGAKVADRLKPGLGDGAYTASFRVTSADSHPIAGSIRFVVGSGRLVHGSESVTSAADGFTSGLDDIARWFAYAGLALVGGSWLLFTVWPAGRDERRVRQLVWTGWGALAAGTVANLALQGPYAAGSGPGGLSDLTLLDATLHTAVGTTLCLRLLLLAALGLVFERLLRAGVRRGENDLFAALIAVAVIATFAGLGHASTTSPSWLSMILDGLHLLAMATWLGGLVILLAGVLPRSDTAELRVVLPVFSTVAFGCVVTLAGTGAYAAWRGVGSIHALFATTYGLLVVGKVALFVGLLAVANLSRRNVNRRTVAYATAGGADVAPNVAAPDSTIERELLRRSVLVETVLGVLVLAVTAVLVYEPRGPEALAAQYRNPVSATTPLGGSASVTVTVDPALRGPVDVIVDVHGKPHASVALTATQHQAEIGPLPIELTRLSRTGGDSEFDATATLPAAGDWDFDLVVSTSQFDATTADVTITLH
ncbi:MAG TPA: copper resistance protein CopC [Jatrophihabitans sp.]|jgi:copper transport protein